MSRFVSVDDLPRRGGAMRLRRPVRFKRRRFGRRRAFTTHAPAVRSGGMGDDIRLFTATFAAGFLFVSVLIA